MASGTALVYGDEMATHRLLWDDPVCDIEVPERLSSCYEHLKRYNLTERCMSVPVREGTEEEIMLVHSLDYLEIVKSTQEMEEEQLRKISAEYDAVYFHPSTYRCAKLAVGAALKLVDAVLSGQTRNGMALVRPPGHHSQKKAANGFCIFNNVAIAAKYAQKKYGLQRILIVDWDVHHGQGIQYIFDEDPSVLYFSWHRFEHQQFWPCLSESNYDAVGQGKGRGFNINVPWNKVGMGNSDYVTTFLHVLLPVAFEFDPELVLVSAGYDSGIGDPEGQMSATPECFAHLTHFLKHLAQGKLCLVLEGGYHLRSLSESVCMTIKTLLGDPLPHLSGEMAPCLSAVESIHNVRAIHKQYWKSLGCEDIIQLEELSTRPCQMGETETTGPGTEVSTIQEDGGASKEDEATKIDRLLELHMKKVVFPIPPIRLVVTLDESNVHLLPASVQILKQTDVEELKPILSGYNAELTNEERILNSLGNILTVLEKIVRGEMMSGLAVSSMVSLSSSIVLKHCNKMKLQKILCVFFGDVDMNIDLNNGQILLINICAKESERPVNKYNVYLNWKEDAETNSFFSTVLGFVLPIAYSYCPDLTLVVVGPKQNFGKNGISLLISLLRALARSQILVLMQDTEVKLLQDIAKSLSTDFIPYYGAFAPHSKESEQIITELKEQLQQEWKMLQCSANGSIAAR